VALLSYFVHGFFSSGHGPCGINLLSLGWHVQSFEAVTFFFQRNLSFSQPYFVEWSLLGYNALSFGDVSKYRVFIFRARSIHCLTVKMKAPRFFETSGTRQRKPKVMSQNTIGLQFYFLFAVYMYRFLWGRCLTFWSLCRLSENLVEVNLKNV
jgi:hypothetical protein